MEWEAAFPAIRRQLPFGENHGRFLDREAVGEAIANVNDRVVTTSQPAQKLSLASPATVLAAAGVGKGRDQPPAHHSN